MCVERSGTEMYIDTFQPLRKLKRMSVHLGKIR